MTNQLSIPDNALSEKEVAPFPALTFTTRATLRTLTQHVAGIPEKMYDEAERLGLSITGPIQWIYTGATGQNDTEFLLEIALPISQPGPLSSTFGYKIFPAFRCVAYTFTGPWSDFHYVYGQLFGLARAANHSYNGELREEYAVVDFHHQENCVTTIQIGLG